MTKHQTRADKYNNVYRRVKCPACGECRKAHKRTDDSGIICNATKRSDGIITRHYICCACGERFKAVFV